MTARLVIDTNVFVAAGFNPDSAAAQILTMVDARAVDLVWSDRTRAETRRILKRIPPLDWDRFAPMFRPDGRHAAALEVADYGFVDGELDREFLALAEAAQAVLVSNDSDLLGPREQARVPVLTPGECLAALEGDDRVPLEHPAKTERSEGQ